MKTPNFGPYHIRKWFLQVDDTLATESGALADGAPLRKIVIAAALHNPFAGRFEADLSSFITPSPMLGEEFGRRIREAAAGLGLQTGDERDGHFHVGFVVVQCHGEAFDIAFGQQVQRLLAHAQGHVAHVQGVFALGRQGFEL